MTFPRLKDRGPIEATCWRDEFSTARGLRSKGHRFWPSREWRSKGHRFWPSREWRRQGGSRAFLREL